MINFNLVTILPDMFKALTDHGLVGQAVQSGKIGVEVISPRQFTSDTHKTVDDRPYGGGDGMVMLADPLSKVLADLESRRRKGRVSTLR